MGGRGATSSIGAGSGKSVSTVTVQNGTAELNVPLVYGGRAQMTDAQRRIIDDREKKWENENVENLIFLDKNGNIVVERKGDTTSVGVSNYELMQTEVMTHNHPRSGDADKNMLGGTFSDADMQIFAQAPMKTMRASAYEGTYTITKGSNFNYSGFSRYASSVSSKRDDEHRARSIMAVLNSSNAEEYNKLVTDSFNRFLVDVHNDLIAGQQKYGYTYSLEKRN